jgi:hypothetical protein
LPFLILFVPSDRKWHVMPDVVKYQELPRFCGKVICPPIELPHSKEDQGKDDELRMNRMIAPTSVVCVSLVIALAAFPAAAMDRSKGDYWTYTMSFDATGFGASGINANGILTYTCVDQDTITIGGTSYDVNVMRVSGGASGGVGFLGLEVSSTLGGFIYETLDGMALAKGDLFAWTNMTFGTGTFQLSSRAEIETMTTYYPPLLSGFNPSTVGLGDTWTETVESSTTTTEWINGTMQGIPAFETGILTYTNVVASARETVTTEAGTFEAFRITSTDSDGNSVVYWWSSKAQNFIKEDTYEPGSATPVMTMVLKDYNTGSSVSLALVAALGGIVLVVALVVLALVLLKRRKPFQPSPYRPEMPYPPPPSPPPVPPGQ